MTVRALTHEAPSIPAVETERALVPRRVAIPATDGVKLGGYVHAPRGEARLSALILPGIGVPQRVFRHFAGWLARNGVRAVTVDYRGMGESLREGHAGATLSIWASRDAVGALRFAETFGAPVVLVGHSFGGQLLGFSDEFRRVRAAVLVGSQFGQARHWDGFARLRIAAYWRLILPAATTFFESVPGWTGLGEALPRGVAREWARWGRTYDWLLPHVDGARERYRAFDRPIRAYAMQDDAIAPPRSIADLLARFESSHVDRRDLAPSDLGLKKLGHLGLFRPGPTQRIWREILDFAVENADPTTPR
ncbi:MAG TPA: alpha/beta fold hydrolase [Polyangiaceae bacterium]